jgi:flagellar motor switch protein FliN/FliY
VRFAHRAPEDLVDVMVNNTVIARGEVVVVAGNYGVRVTEVMSTTDRIRSMAG